MHGFQAAGLGRYICMAVAGCLLALCPVPLAAAETGTLVEEDYATVTKTAWTGGLAGFSPTDVGLRELPDGLRVLELQFHGLSWVNFRLPPLPAETVFGIEMDARCVGQVESIDLFVGSSDAPVPISDDWPVASEWTNYRTQFRLAKAAGPQALTLRIRGTGRIQARRFRVTAANHFELPAAPPTDRGEIITNSNFALGDIGWYVGHPNDYRHHANRNAMGAITFAGPGQYALTLPEDNAAIDSRFITGIDLVRLYYGKTYTLQVRGTSGARRVRLQMVQPTLGQQPVVYKTWDVNLGSGTWRQEFEMQPPETGVVRRGDRFFFRLEVLGGGRTQIRQVSVFEGPAGDGERAETGIELAWPGDPLTAVAVAGAPINLVIRAAGLSAGEVGELVAVDYNGRESHNTKLTLQTLEDGGVGCRARLTDLPTGWYELFYRAGGDTVRAHAREIAVVPRLQTLADRRSFLGTHFRGFYERAEVAGAMVAVPSLDVQRIMELRQWGFVNNRQFFGWGAFQPSPETWFEPDQEFAKLVRADVNTLLTVNGTPKWAQSGKGELELGADSPREPEQWQEAFERIVRHYHGAVHEFEIGNEPDLGRGLTPRGYVQMVKLAYAAGKRANPDATFVAGATTTSGLNYLLQCIDLGLLDACDVISFHGYVREMAADDGPKTFQDFVVPLGLAMAKLGKVKPVWDTEAGFAIPDGREGLALSELHLKGILVRRAAGITRFYSYMAAPKGNPGAAHYNMYQGFADRPTMAVPMVAAYQQLVDGLDFDSNIGRDPDGLHGYLFRGDGSQRVIAAWRSAGSNEPTLHQQAISSGLILDEMGQPAGEFAGGALPLTNQVKYYLPADNASLSLFGSHR